MATKLSRKCMEKHWVSLSRAKRGRCNYRL